MMTTYAQRVVILAAACVAATLGTFSVALTRRLRLWVSGRNGVKAYVGNHDVGVEAVRLVKQTLLAYGTFIVQVGNVRVILISVSILMAFSSVWSVWHQWRLSRMLEKLYE